MLTAKGRSATFLSLAGTTFGGFKFGESISERFSLNEGWSSTSVEIVSAAVFLVAAFLAVVYVYRDGCNSNLEQ